MLHAGASRWIDHRVGPDLPDAQFGAHIKAELAKSAKVVKAANLKSE